MTQILDGRAIAAEIKAELQAALTNLGKVPGLGTILVGADPASRTYVAGKHRDCAEVGIKSIQIELPATASEAEVLAAVHTLNADPECTGFIVQLPLPTHISAQRVLEAIDPAKDADGLHPLNLGRLVLNHPAPLPCTPLGIVELVARSNLSWAGKEVVVIGRGATVGRPLSLLLSQRNLDATVTTVHTGTQDIAAHTKRAEILIAAIGRAHFVTAEMVRPGAILIDVGLTRTESGLLGDICPDAYKLAAAYSPVPGGVGPMTRALLLKNVIELAQQS